MMIYVGSQHRVTATKSETPGLAFKKEKCDKTDKMAEGILITPRSISAPHTLARPINAGLMAV